MPGVIDTHSHTAVEGGVNEISLPNTGMVRIADALDVGGAAGWHPPDLGTVVGRGHHDLLVGGHPFVTDGNSDQLTLAHEF